MADDKYSIDDILAEVDTKRDGSDESGGYDGSITDIIGGTELDDAIRSVDRMRGVPSHRRVPKKGASADLAAIRAQEAERRRQEQQRREAEQLNERLAARQRTEQESQMRLAAEISAAADKITESDEHDPGYSSEMASPYDTAELFGAGGAENEDTAEVKVFGDIKIPENDDDVKVFGQGEDIVFHDVPTETMQIRKQKRVEEFKRALLRTDMEAESPDELLDSLNPLDSRARAAEALNGNVRETTDTLAVAGNDLKKIAGGEAKVKEYSPVTSRRRADDVLFSAAGRQSSREKSDGDFVDSLNKQVQEQREKSRVSEATYNIDKMDEAEKQLSEPLNIDLDKKLIDTSIINATDNTESLPDPVEQVRRADELAQKKKRRLSGFILEDISDEVESAAEEDDEDEEEEDEEIDLDDENVIADRLERASKGLLGRLVILGALLAVALFIAITNQFGINMGVVTELVNKITHPDYYLYSFLIIGILSFTACSSVITNGFSRLVKLRPDGDTLCALAHITAIAAIIPYLAQVEYIHRGRSHIYLIVSLTALCFNTVSKLFTVRAARRNFGFTSGDRAKYFVQNCDSEGAHQLARTAVTGIPAVASMRKTELLCDFIISTYCEDVSDRIARAAAPATICAAIGGGLFAYFMGESQYVMNNVSWASTVVSGIFSIGAAFTGSLIVTLPMLSASRKMTAKNCAILGYGAVEEFSETNAVLIDAKTLFPANSVKVNNIWNYNKHKKTSTPKVQLDEAIIYAASLAVAADSVMADAFFGMLNYKQQLLKSVSNCVYESNLGVLGWIDRRRVLIGNREHMKSHEITVPDMKKVKAANKNDDEVIYLAVGGEVILLFFVELTANNQVKQNVDKLSKNGVSLVIKTVDGMVTDSVIAELFDIDAEQIRVIPFEQHDIFNENTKFIPKGSAAVSCDGTFTSFAAAINGAKALRSRIGMGCIMQIAGTGLGILLALIFVLFTNYGMFNCFYILLYNLAWVIITIAGQAFRRL